MLFPLGLAPPQTFCNCHKCVISCYGTHSNPSEVSSSFPKAFLNPAMFGNPITSWRKKNMINFIILKKENKIKM